MRRAATSILVVVLLSPLALCQAAAATPDLRELIRKAAENDEVNDKKMRDYAFVERVEQHKLDGSGKEKSVETHTYEIINLYGEPVSRLIAKNDKPLEPKEAQKEEDRINKVAEKRKNDSPEAKKKRLEKEAKEREEERAFDKELGEAFHYTLVGEEDVNGRPAWIIAGEPKPGYQPKLRAAKMLAKMHGKVWIDKQDVQFVRGEIELLDTISYGGIIARVHKGTRVNFEQVRVNDEVWLPQVAAAHLDERLLLFKGYNENINVAYRDYKKFRTDSRVVGVVGEVAEPPASPPAAKPPQL
jgi:hypothetical protein